MRLFFDLGEMTLGKLGKSIGGKKGKLTGKNFLALMQQTQAKGMGASQLAKSGKKIQLTSIPEQNLNPKMLEKSQNKKLALKEKGEPQSFPAADARLKKVGTGDKSDLTLVKGDRGWVVKQPKGVEKEAEAPLVDKKEMAKKGKSTGKESIETAPVLEAQPEVKQMKEESRSPQQTIVANEGSSKKANSDGVKGQAPVIADAIPLIKDSPGRQLDGKNPKKELQIAVAPAQEKVVRQKQGQVLEAPNSSKTEAKKTEGIIKGDPQAKTGAPNSSSFKGVPDAAPAEKARSLPRTEKVVKETSDQTKALDRPSTSTPLTAEASSQKELAALDKASRANTNLDTLEKKLALDGQTATQLILKEAVAAATVNSDSKNSKKDLKGSHVQVKGEVTEPGQNPIREATVVTQNALAQAQNDRLKSEAHMLSSKGKREPFLAASQKKQSQEGAAAKEQQVWIPKNQHAAVQKMPTSTMANWIASHRESLQAAKFEVTDVQQQVVFEKRTLNEIKGKPLTKAPVLKESRPDLLKQVSKEPMKPGTEQAPLKSVLAQSMIADGKTNSKKQTTAAAAEAGKSAVGRTKQAATQTPQAVDVSPKVQVSPNAAQQPQSVQAAIADLAQVEVPMQESSGVRDPSLTRAMDKVTAKLNPSLNRVTVPENMAGSVSQANQADPSTMSADIHKDADSLHQPLFRDLEAQLAKAVRVRPNAISVKLSPEVLGELRIRVVKRGEQLQAKIQAENPQTADLISEQQSKLEERLREQGIDISEFDIYSEGGLGQQAGQDQSGWDRQAEYEMRNDIVAGDPWGRVSESDSEREAALAENEMRDAWDLFRESPASAASVQT
jgi:hypothetical protein